MNFIKSLCVIISISYGCFITVACANDDTNIEYKIKAGYLYNFTKFITWSKNPVSTFNLCILGEDPFGSAIDPIEQRSALGKPIKLFRLNTINTRQHCHILYMNNTVSEMFLTEHTTLPAFENTLIVGEGEQYAIKVGMIGFIHRAGKIKLTINLNRLQKSGLRVSAKLLEVAEMVTREDDDQ